MLNGCRIQRGGRHKRTRRNVPAFLIVEYVQIMDVVATMAVQHVETQWPVTAPNSRSTAHAAIAGRLFRRDDGHIRPTCGVGVGESSQRHICNQICCPASPLRCATLYCLQPTVFRTGYVAGKVLWRESCEFSTILFPVCRAAGVCRASHVPAQAGNGCSLAQSVGQSVGLSARPTPGSVNSLVGWTVAGLSLSVAHWPAGSFARTLPLLAHPFARSLGLEERSLTPLELVVPEQMQRWALPHS